MIDLKALIASKQASIASIAKNSHIEVIPSIPTGCDDILDIKIETESAQSAEIEEQNEIFTKLAELEQSLILLHPTMPVLLQRIHKQLKSDPAIVTLLSDEQINIIFQALEVHTNTVLIDTTKPRKRKVSIEDI